MNEYKCLDCESIINSEKEIKKCSCGSSNITENILNKNQILSYINEETEKEEDPFFRRFLVEEIEEEDQVKKVLKRCYDDICDIIEQFLDIDEKLKKIVAIWIIGTYFHNQFNTYPYLFINAMRGSGKTRLLRIISELSKDGEMQNSMTEAVLFRSSGTLCIDEFERAGRKGSENLLELLNSAYKKGTKVKRMKKQKTWQGEEQIIEEFDVFRPIVVANISGMDNVLGDRCIKIVLEKSLNQKKTRMMETLLESRIKRVKQVLSSIAVMKCSLCSVVSPAECSIKWNSYLIQPNYTLFYISSETTLTTLTTLKQKFDKILATTIDGRDLELAMPLLTIAIWIDGAFGVDGFFDEVLEILDEISKNKKQEESIENLDFSLYSMVAQRLEATSPTERYIPIQELTEEFRKFVQSNEEWLNNKWMGRALSRLNLVKQKRRLTRGVEVILDYKKAEEKTGLFNPKE